MEQILEKIFDKSSNLSNEEAVTIAKLLANETKTESIPFNHESSNIIEAINIDPEEIKSRLMLIAGVASSTDGKPVSNLLENFESILLNNQKNLRCFLLHYVRTLKEKA